MGVRLQCDADNFYEDQILIEIIDTSYGGGVIPFKTRLSDCVFRVNGAPNNRYKRICTSEFRFKMLVENDDHRQFFEDMADQDEGRFYVKVYTNTEGDYGLRFVGHLVMDETWLLNKSSAQFIDITASDGLYRLTDQEYKSDAEDQTNAYGNDIYFYEGFDTILNIIYKCLSGLKTQDLYGASDTFLAINCNWYESNHSSLSGSSPLEWIRVNQRIFTKKDEDENYFTMTKQEVLETILTTFNARLSYVWGTYYLESINERGKSGRTFKNYDKSGTYINSATVFKKYTFDGTHKRRVLADGKFGHLAPIKTSCVELSYTLGNYGYTPNYWSNDNTSLISLGDVEVTSNETAIFIGLVISFYLDPTGIPTDELLATVGSVWFGLTVKFGSYYYVTEVTTDTELVGYDDNGDEVFQDIYLFENKWSSTAGTYLFYGGGSFDLLTRTFQRARAEFTTDPLMNILDPDAPIYSLGDVDELSVGVEFVKIVGSSPKYDYNSGTTYDADFNVIWRTLGSKVEPREGNETVLSTESATKYCYENNVNNSTNITAKTMIGDVAFNSNNRIEVYDGANWVGSTASWAVGSIPAAESGLRIQELLVQEIARGQQKTHKRYVGEFEGMFDPFYLIDYDGITWVPFNFSFNLYNRRINGEFYEYNYDAIASFVVDTQGTRVETSGSLTSSISNPNTAEPQVTQIAYPVSVAGADSATIDMSDYPLPDPSVVDAGQISYLLNIYRGGVRLWYAASPSGMHEYSINFGASTITLGRALRTGENIKGVIFEIVE